MSKKTSLPVAIWIVALIIVNFGIWSATANVKNLGEFRIYSLDVGQGDAALLITPNGEQILVDTGANDEIITLLNNHISLWDRELDLVVISHWHDDHAGGLLSVLDNFEVNELLAPNTTPERYGNTFSENLNINYADPSDDYTWGSVSWDTLWPPFGWEATDDPNDDSIIAKVSFSGTDFLFTGDAPSEIEQGVLSIYPTLTADIVKISHHGSKYSSSQNFVDTLNAKVGIISAGLNNRYNHPHQEALDRWNAAGVEIYRTDQDGTIEIIIAPERITITTNGEKEFY
ncbi:MAG: ComEC/Rec2 family competence protein [Patescibacteria group bacterium]|nr:ComEC/Rec2 family competence protein [Patescibacteria group bacterium]